MITITINGKECLVKEGVTIIDAARANGIDIPALGYDPRVSPPSNVEAAFVEATLGEKKDSSPQLIPLLNQACKF